MILDRQKQQRKSDLEAKIRSQNAFIELLLDRLDKPETRSSRQQSTFRGLLIEEYEAKHPEDDGIWCPVLKKFFCPMMIRAVHIIPYKLGQKRMETIFGPDSAHELYSARNGLLLHGSVEDKFDRHLLIIVPDTPIPANGPIIRWRLRVLDQTILDQEVKWTGDLSARSNHSPITYRELDGELLQFRSKRTRPAARYLYFHYVVALLQARRHRRQGWLQQQTAELAWATPGRYMLRSMMPALAESAGHSVDSDTRVFEQHIIEDVILPSSDTRIFAHQCLSKNLLQRSPEEAVCMDDGGNDDDDDDDYDCQDEDYY